MSEAPERKAIDRLLRPRSIAIVGASAEPGAPGARVLANLEALGFPGAIHLVTRRVTEINGRRCVPTIADLPPGIDAAVLIVPEAAVADAIGGCIERGIGGISLFTAGFAETGEEGRAKQEKIAALARAAGLALEGPNCMGFSNFVDRVSVSFGAVETGIIAAGPHGAAVIAQSGAMMGNIASALGAKGVAVNYTISTGNEAVTSAEDFLDAVLDDPQTRLFVLFLEQIRMPARFLELVARARQLGKPVVLMHPGNTERARESARSHTGALAGDHAVMQTVLRHAGVVQVETMDELIDTATLLARWPQGATKGAAIVSNSGAVRGIALDFCKDIGFDVPKLSAATEMALQAHRAELCAGRQSARSRHRRHGAGRYLWQDRTHHVGGRECRLRRLGDGAGYAGAANGESQFAGAAGQGRDAAGRFRDHGRRGTADAGVHQADRRQPHPVFPLARSRDAGDGASLSLWAAIAAAGRHARAGCAGGVVAWPRRDFRASRQGPPARRRNCGAARRAGAEHHPGARYRRPSRLSRRAENPIGGYPA